jgi:hypothetical protein
MSPATVRCAQCSWTSSPPTLGPLDVARCSREFEAHLVREHRAPEDEAQAAAEAWALVALRGQIR